MQFNDHRNILYNAGVETTLEYTRPERVRKKAPSIKLLISAFNIPFCPIEIVSTNVNAIILSCSFEKSRSTPAGSVILTMAGDRDALENIHLPVAGHSFFKSRWDQFGPDLRDIFKPMSIAQLWINGYCACTGFVRFCRRQASSNGAVRYIAQIDELGAIYEGNILSFDTVTAGTNDDVNDTSGSLGAAGSTGTLQQMTKIMEMSGQMGAIPLPDALQSYVRSFLLSQMWIPNSIPPFMMLSDGTPMFSRFIAAEAPLGALATMSSVEMLTVDSAMIQNAQGGNFWGFLKGLLPDPYMELFTETGGRTIVTGRFGMSMPTPMLAGMNYLVARSTPYEVLWTGISPWLATQYIYCLGALDLILGGDYVIITDDDIFDKDLGQSDSQQFTHFFANLGGRLGSAGNCSRMPPSIAGGPKVPLYPGGVRTFGRRQFEATIPATSYLAEGLSGQSLEDTYRSYRLPINVPTLATMLNVWFRNASKFNEGTVKTRCMGYARPGMYLLYLPSLSGSRVECARDIGLYYIDNVTHSYELGKPDTSTFSLIRGVPIPMDMQGGMRLLFDWEIIPPMPALFDGGL